jgi:cytochrome P450 family 6
VNVVETLYTYTTDVTASCAFGINSHSLKDPNAELNMLFRKVFDFSVRRGLAGLTAFYAPSLKSLLKLKFVDEDTNSYLRKTVWNTV